MENLMESLLKFTESRSASLLNELFLKKLVQYPFRPKSLGQVTYGCLNQGAMPTKKLIQYILASTIYQPAIYKASIIILKYDIGRVQNQAIYLVYNIKSLHTFKLFLI